MREVSIARQLILKRTSQYIASSLAALTALAALLVLISAGTSHAQGVPENLQAAIFYKVLAYDYNLQSKAGNQVTIAIVTDGKTAGRQQTMLEGFNKIKGQQLGGKTINIIVVKITNPASLGDATKGDILYLPEGSDEKTVNAVLTFAEKDKHATLGGSETLASKGCAIGLAVEDGKPKIVINLPASQAQGMNLSSKVLRLAKVIQ